MLKLLVDENPDNTIVHGLRKLDPLSQCQCDVVYDSENVPIWRSFKTAS
jgi:hypothetical protein